MVGWLPERFPSGRPFSVQAYLRGMASVQGIGAAEAWSRIGTLAERLQFAPFLGTPLASVSQGTRRKVGLTHALLRRPGLLVLDDPWEGLDATSQAVVPELLAEVTAAGGSCVLTDHRGRSGDLGPVRRWRVQDGRVEEVEGHEVDAPAEQFAVDTALDVVHEPPHPCHVIEIAVRDTDASAAVASLRAAGYDVRSVRTEARGRR